MCTLSQGGCLHIYDTTVSVSLCVLCVAASPAMRGSTPLDVAASSVMDNNGLALALEEPDLDKVGFSLLQVYACFITVY